MTRTSAALSWLRRIFWSAKLARIGLTTFTPTTISCAVAGPGAMDKIPTKKAAFNQRRFMPCMRSPGRWATDSTKPSRGWQGDGAVPVTRSGERPVDCSKMFAVAGRLPVFGGIFLAALLRWPQFGAAHCAARAISCLRGTPSEQGFPSSVGHRQYANERDR
jgi:hypothetical protein